MNSTTAILQNVGGALSQVKSGLAFSFPPPAIPGVGTSGGVTFMLEDRSAARPGVPDGQPVQVHAGGAKAA